MGISPLKASLLLAVLSLTGCSELTNPVSPAAKTETEKKEPAVPAEPVTAKTAFWEMYKSAHAWAPDLMPLKMEAKVVPGSKGPAWQGGKAAMWEASFGSMSRKEARNLTYSIVSQPPDIHKGVSIGGPIPWFGQTHDAMAFQTAEFVVDSDAAYETAVKSAAAWLKKNPDKELTTMSLGNAARFPGPVWYFLWGNTKSGYFLLVNASTGKPMAK